MAYALVMIIPETVQLSFEELVKLPALPRVEEFVGVGTLHEKEAV